MLWDILKGFASEKKAVYLAIYRPVLRMFQKLFILGKQFRGEYSDEGVLVIPLCFLDHLYDRLLRFHFKLL